MHQPQRRRNAIVAESAEPPDRQWRRAHDVRPQHLHEHQLRELGRGEQGARPLCRHLPHQLVEQPAQHAGFGKGGAHMNNRRQHVGQQLHALRPERDVATEIMEILANAVARHAVDLLLEGADRVSGRDGKVARQDEGMPAVQKRNVARLEQNGFAAIVEAKPAAPFGNRADLDPVRPGKRSAQAPPAISPPDTRQRASSRLSISESGSLIIFER